MWFENHRNTFAKRSTSLNIPSVAQTLANDVGSNKLNKLIKRTLVENSRKDLNP